MDKKKDDNYQEGWDDAAGFFLQSHVPVKDVIESFDKFFDKVSRLKRLLKMVYNHFKMNKDIYNKTIESDQQKQENIEKIIKLIEESFKGETDGKKESDSGATSKN